MGEGLFEAAGSLRAAYEGVDWSGTALGPLSSWSSTLRGAVDLALLTQFPVTLLWGPELVLVYNEAYIPLIADKHPSALGAPAREVFPEVWDDIAPLLEGVLEIGAAMFVQDAHLPLQRRGRLEECYFTFSYSPVRGRDGVVEGVLDIATETTGEVVGRRRLQLLTHLEEALADARTGQDVTRCALAVLSTDPADLPAVDVRHHGSPPPEAQPGALDRGAALPGAPRSPLAGRTVLVEAGEGGAVAWLPLGGDEGPVGVLVVGLSEHLAPDETYLRFLRLVAASLSRALDRVQARESRRAVRAVAEQAAASSAVLARIATALTEDAEAAVADLPRALVPALADWSLLTLVDEGPGNWRSRLRDVGSWHVDPSKRELTERYRRARIPALVESSYIAQAFTTSEIVVVQEGGAAAACAVLTGVATDLCAELAPEAFAVVPLRARGRTLGVLSVYNGAARGPFSANDVASLGEVASRVGLVLDNARLRASERDLATELQTSLLTELPQPEHLHITARYFPAARGTQVGGDWYDAFLVRDGSTALVIGDVAGHDREATVAMAQVRNVLRGVAHALVDPPAAILSALDWAMADLAVASLATAVLAKIEQGPAERARGLRTLRWSNAGHPPPLLVGPDGRAELLTGSATGADTAPPGAPDLLLGLHSATPRHDHTHLLLPGSTVLLYTDGLIERRGEDLQVGFERLRAAAARHAGRGLGLEAFCDALLTDLVGESGGAEDDVALLAVRAHPEDRPRPAEAGDQVLPRDLREHADPSGATT